MKQSIEERHERPLLTHAISKLRPEVFSHPAWIRFSKKERPILPEIVQDLLHEAEHLHREHPSDACQILLICAVHQNYAGQRSTALATLRKALDLAESAGLTQETLWVIWGACAISVQEGNYEQADMHLRRLQTALHEQNEWMLADYIDVIRQYFLSPWNAGEANYSTYMAKQELTTLLSSTLDLLYTWGFSSNTDPGLPIIPTMESTPVNAPLTRTILSPADRQGPWHTLRLIFQGELKLHWIENDPPPARNRASFWDAMLDRMRFHRSTKSREAEIVEVESYIPGQSTPEIVPIRPPPRPAPQKQEPAPEDNFGDIKPVEQTAPFLAVSVHMLGKFEMAIQDDVLDLPASRNLSVLKYLILHHTQNIPREVLMDVFWPGSEPDTARNNLNVAIHGIRRALRKSIDLPLILYKDGSYSISPSGQLWLDVEEFEHQIHSGQRLEAKSRLAAISAYEAAVSIYQGDFLQENPYEEWTVLPREHLRASYLNALDRLSQIYFTQEHYAPCITICQRILSYDQCREDAYCLLMRCYSRQGQDHLALRQYLTCVKALRAELDVEPAPETTKIYNRIRRHEQV